MSGATSKTTTIQISSVSEYIPKILQIIDYSGKGNWVYRGVAQQSHKLIPQLYRLNVQGKPRYSKELDWFKAESNFLSNFYVEGFRHFKTVPADSLMFSNLIYAQHYGVPTRLLDWTANPLVALYFACLPNSDLKTSESCGSGKVYLKSIQGELNGVGLNVPIQNNSNTDKPVNSFEIEDCFNEIKKPYFFFLPPYIDERMTSQKSIFSFHRHPEKGSNFVPLEADNNNGIVTIEIAENKKKGIQKELKLLRVDNFFLFPTLDNLGEKIRNMRF
jgi:hypothetical protein